jgi:succinate dehydrogenase hydrophobic anchor subunit
LNNLDDYDNAPDWSLLPHEPARFFGLDSGFDRKDLKRSYNRLLRLYKPEKHPVEFQQIRAAYEDLERRLRYGEAREATGEANWKSTDTPVKVTHHGEASSDDKPVAEAIDLEALATRLESGDESLAAAYDSLAKKRHKTPPDFYALALMGDAKGPAEEQLLLRWLLQGLKAWPGDSAMSQLVYGYLRTQAPIDAIPALLVMVSKVITNDGFYRLTEGAWERLLREQPFAIFVKTLERCEANVAEGAGGDPAIGGRVAFYLFALRHALWKDESDWKDRALEFVEEHFDQAPEHLVNDLDGLMIVREYLTHRAEFIAVHPLRARLDAVLEAAYTRDQLEVDRMMTECQREIMASPEAVAEAFPAIESAACQAFYPLWAWLSDDIAARLAPPVEDAKDFRLWKSRIIDFLAESKNKKSWSANLWSLASFGKYVLRIGCTLIVIVLTLLLSVGASVAITDVVTETAKDLAMGIGTIVAIVATAVVTLFFWKWFSVAFDRRFWGPFCRSMADRCYRRVWRPQALSFMQRSVLDFFTFRELVAQVAAEAPPDERTWMSHFIQQDFGLAVYSLAQRFRE